jgi:dGTPase
MELRARIEAEENERLAPWAARAAHSLGRLRPEPEHAYRTCFQRDRDRVLHSRAFRRLQYKTQVFVHHEGDHFRSRLTHTLEVAQIARTVARALSCNEDLTEAIVLAHDLGHTPFGHAGERALHELLAAHGGFEHNRQSLRIADWLELRSEQFRGLNLTHETRAGLLKHGAEFPRYGHPVPLPELGAGPSAEAQIANLADAIAYNAHDVDDGLRAGLLAREPLEELELVRTALARLSPAERGGSRGLLTAQLIDFLVTDLVEHSRRALAAAHAGEEKRSSQPSRDGHGVEQGGEAHSSEEKSSRGRGPIRFSEPAREQLAALASFLRRNLYLHHRVARMTTKGQRILRELWQAYSADRRLLPPGALLDAAAGEPPERAIADYLAGMTDRFAMDEHRKLFDPHVPA